MNTIKMGSIKNRNDFRIYQEETIFASVSTSGFVAFPKMFTSIPSVFIGRINNGALGSGHQIVVTSITKSGFNVALFTIAGGAPTVTISQVSYMARGY
jgi:hypothetical protein